MSIQELADALIDANAALKAAEKAILDAQHVREVTWARERTLRAEVTAQMVVEKITRIDRPAGSIFEIAARTGPEEGAAGGKPGTRRVLSLACLRILHRAPAPAPPADPLFVFKPAACAAPNEPAAEGSPEQRRAG